MKIFILLGYGSKARLCFASSEEEALKMAEEKDFLVRDINLLDAESFISLPFPFDHDIFVDC